MSRRQKPTSTEAPAPVALPPVHVASISERVDTVWRKVHLISAALYGLEHIRARSGDEEVRMVTREIQGICDEVSMEALLLSYSCDQHGLSQTPAPNDDDKKEIEDDGRPMVVNGFKGWSYLEADGDDE